MNFSKGQIAFVNRSANLDGSALSGLASVASLVDRGNRVTVVFGHEGPAISKYQDLGCSVQVLPHGGWLRGGGVVRSSRRVLAEFRLAARARMLLQELNVDLVYVNTLVSYSFALAAKRLRVPCIWHIRELFSDLGGEIFPPALGGKWFVRRELQRLADIIVLNSSAVRENVCGSAITKPIVVVPNAVDVSSFRVSKDVGVNFRRHYGVPLDAYVIGVPGTLRPVKGQLWFVDCLPELRARIPNLHVLFLGDTSGPYAQSVQQRIVELGLQSNASFIGSIENMRDFYAALDQVVICSLSESFGRVAIEAFAAQRPVVASAVGGLREIINHGVNGILANAVDNEEFVRAIVKVHSSPLCSTRLIRQACRDVVEKYSVDAYSHAIVSQVEKFFA
jgi:glycosyltransferase involved in cell wall biosynthesis